MTKIKLTVYMDCFFKACSMLWESKNKDYTGKGTSDPFANFVASEKMTGIPVEQAMLSRMHDKFSRISTYVKEGKFTITEETLERETMDLANYCMALSAYFKSKTLVKK